MTFARFFLSLVAIEAQFYSLGFSRKTVISVHLLISLILVKREFVLSITWTVR
jgi:hypothetical protein